MNEVVESHYAMQRVEQHHINIDDVRWQAVDDACFLSKNLYNAAQYELRQAFIHHDVFIPYAELAKRMKTNLDYCALPRKVSQWVLKQVDAEWRSFFAAQAEYELHPEKFQGRPRLPAYKNKTHGRNLLVYTAQAISLPALKRGFIQPSQLNIQVKTAQRQVDQVRVVPCRSHYVIEIVYTNDLCLAPPNPALVASIDVGLNNLAAVASNKPGFIPFLVNGRPLKSINHFYNQRRAKLQSQFLPGQHISKQLQVITDKRNRQVKAYLHLASRRIVDRLVAEGMGMLVIGKNEGWKQAIDLGKRTNQNFVLIPHAQFIEMLTYKAEQEGIRVILTEESYTSKCSFLDGESIEKHEHYMGKRTQRGLFIASDKRIINADVNAAYNIMRKATPNAFGNGVKGAVVHPSVARL